MKAILTYIGAMIVLAPCLLVFNEGNAILPNLIGFCYIGIYLVASLISFNGLSGIIAIESSIILILLKYDSSLRLQKAA